MTTSEFIEQVICAAKRDHKARKTWQCYAGWARRYALWLRSQSGLHAADSETKVSRYLAHLATRPGGCSPKTQQQALNALVFAYKHGLGTPLGQMPEWVKPPQKQRLPVWLSSSEFQALAHHLEGPCLLIAQIMFASEIRSPLDSLPQPASNIVPFARAA